jgi:opacity protein-like surface antigen
MDFWKKTIQNYIAGIFIFLPLILVNSAHATNDELEFSLSASNQNTYFNFSSNTNEVRSDQLGVSWYENFSPYFLAGLELGYIEMSQINNAITSAQFTSGEYIGLLFRFLPVESPFFTLTLNLNYRYTQTKGKSTNQVTQFSWDNTLLFSELQFQPTKHIGLILAAEYRFLDGVQRDSGNITQITQFEGTEQHGYRLGINFKLNRSQTVRLEWLDGYRQGVQVNFAHKY